MSVQNARTQLMALVTKIMMDEAGFIIDQLLTDSRKQTDVLKREKDQLNQHKDSIHLYGASQQFFLFFLFNFTIR